MLKKIINFCILFFLLMCSVSAEQIKKIEISGNQRISEQTILVLGKISINQDFNDQKINEYFKSLYESKFFQDIKISISNGVLKIDLIENPIIENIEIVGIKNKGFVDKILEDLSANSINKINQVKSELADLKKSLDFNKKRIPHTVVGRKELLENSRARTKRF